ncbi:N-acetylneuraminate synthase [Desulfothermus naphthae]
MKKKIQIYNHYIGDECPCFIVAEIGNNHQGNFELAVKLIEKAKEAGVDAVKFQKRDINSLLTKHLYNSPYDGPNSFGKTYGEHREKVELSVEDFAKLKKIAEDMDILFFASVWDEISLDQMIKIGLEIIKIPSADLVNIPLIRKAATYKKVIFLSTGMSSLEEIDVAVSELNKRGSNYVLLHCNSSYPCLYEEIALPAIKQLMERYSCLVGYSGHEIGIYPSLASICYGACVVEKHFTLDKDLPGSDHCVSLTPDEMKKLVQGIRIIEKSIIVKEKKVFDREYESSKKLRKSIVASRDIKKGEILSENNITVKSPGTGLSPIYWDYVIGKKVNQDYLKDDFILLDEIE